MAELMQEINSFTGWLLIASLKSLPLIAILLLAQYGLKKYLSAGARHSLWLSLFLCLSIPFGWQFSFDIRPTELLFSSMDNNATYPSGSEIITSPTAAAEISQTNIENDLHQTPNSATTSLTSHSIFSLIWIFIFSGLIFITSWQLFRFKRVLQKASNAPSQDYLLLQNAQHTLGFSQKIPLLYSSKVSSPLTLGLFKPAIILPIGIERQLTENQLRLVLLHELAHIHRRDILWNWLAYGITLLHWFNPLIWLASKRMKADMEMACDAKVLSHLSPQDRNDYGLTLINVSQLASKPLGFAHSLGILENHRELKDRLIMMKEFTTMTLKKSLIFGMLFSAFAFAALAQPFADNSSPQQKSPTANQPHESAMSLQTFASRAEKDLGKKILVGFNGDTRIQTNLNENPIDYKKLLAQLQINGFTAFTSEDYIQIVSVRDARSLAPIVEKGKKYYDDEFVTDYIKLDKSCAGSVLATIRPLVPQYSHLTTYEDAKTLIIVDSYSNIQRVRSVIATIEKNIDSPKDCNRTQTVEPTPQQLRK
ncbi:M56 family metallopeptidase [Cellvibrio fibrivorans]|uniref:Beta-lactamase regulating signal transducer with metallopeptidase domain n=1 Tax=Cellvibrio fibrivorans TaxID=126350 RepID=A0ABU1V3V7_9GAMM|nr:M56 family metallopeptidase [Cellvibrio fibrivorans]MDR7092062.1 beta-lactamase regulating signal transducer with metallopeptidase domain [Cellvibrio fibrivorans]